MQQVDYLHRKLREIKIDIDIKSICGCRYCKSDIEKDKILISELVEKINFLNGKK